MALLRVGEARGIVAASVRDLGTVAGFHCIAAGVIWWAWRWPRTWTRWVTLLYWIGLGFLCWNLVMVFDGRSIQSQYVEPVVRGNLIHWGVFFLLAATFLRAGSTLLGPLLVKKGDDKSRKDFTIAQGPRFSIWNGLSAMTFVAVFLVGFQRGPFILVERFGYTTGDSLWTAGIAFDAIASSLAGAVCWLICGRILSDGKRYWIRQLALGLVVTALATVLMYAADVASKSYMAWLMQPINEYSLSNLQWKANNSLRQPRWDIAHAGLANLLILLTIWFWDSLGYRLQTRAPNKKFLEPNV